MAGYIGSKTSVTQVDGYNRTEADAEFVNVTGDTMTGNLSFGDNDKAIFGAGSDLQIYHDGSNSYIEDAGTGWLLLKGNDSGIAAQDGSGNYVWYANQNGFGAYYNNSVKLATTSTGVDISDTATSEPTITLKTAAASNFMSIARDSSTGHYNFTSEETGSSIQFFTDPDGTGADKRLTIDRYGDISFYEDTGTTPKFFWDASAESLGIGTTAIYAKLAIGTGTGGGNIPANTSVLFGSDDNRNIQFLGQTTSGVEGTIGAWNGVYNFQSSKIVFNKPSGNLGEMQFFTNQGAGPVERMRITSSGELVNTGSTLPSASVQGFGVQDQTIYTSATSTSTRNHHIFYNGNGAVGSIKTSGSSTSYNTSSDYRLKTDAQPMTGASARVQALNPVNFEWIADGTRVDGFLAHEAQAVAPEAVTGTKDAMRDEEYEVTPAVYEDVIIPAVLDDEGNELEAERTEQQLVTEAVMGTRSVPDYQGIDQSKLVPLLTAALQEALTEISDLKARVVALEAV